MPTHSHSHSHSHTLCIVTLACYILHYGRASTTHPSKRRRQIEYYADWGVRHNRWTLGARRWSVPSTVAGWQSAGPLEYPKRPQRPAGKAERWSAVTWPDNMDWIDSPTPVSSAEWSDASECIPPRRCETHFLGQDIFVLPTISADPSDAPGAKRTDLIPSSSPPAATPLAAN